MSDGKPMTALEVAGVLRDMRAPLSVAAAAHIEALVDVLSRWLAYAEEELSEFDLEICVNSDLCRACQSAGCINTRIRETREALSSATPPVESKSEVVG